MGNEKAAGHAAALLTVFIWGTTFISTKVLLVGFSPIEILLFRFVLGFAALYLVCPRLLRGTTARQELTFAAAGLCGVCLYYLLENIALTYTLASNVGVIVASSPFFTAMLFRFVLRSEEDLRPGFWIGFAAAMAGIFLISTGGTEIQINPLGDLLALLAAVAWACYSCLTKKISGFGYPVIMTTRRTFFYGILLMLPTLLFFDAEWNFALLRQPSYLLNILYLGFGASALCFVTWNVAMKRLGAVKTSVYIYLVPVLTVLMSMLLLRETLTLQGVIGIALTLAGLMLSERKGKRAA